MMPVIDVRAQRFGSTSAMAVAPPGRRQMA
jgi:hypothetical protein